jgi:hypothetical protein
VLHINMCFIFSSYSKCFPISLPVVLYGRQIWSLTLKEEHRLRVFENRVLRRIFEPNRVELIGGWTKWHNNFFITCTLRQI